MANARRDFNVWLHCTCKCASCLSDGVKLAKLTSFFQQRFLNIFPTSDTFYKKSKASINHLPWQTPKFSLFLPSWKKSRLKTSVCSRRLGLTFATPSTASLSYCIDIYMLPFYWHHCTNFDSRWAKNGSRNQHLVNWRHSNESIVYQMKEKSRKLTEKWPF